MADETAAELAAMRAWVADCEWADETEDLSDAEIARGIEHHYGGGLAAFRADSGLEDASKVQSDETDRQAIAIDEIRSANPLSVAERFGTVGLWDEIARKLGETFTQSDLELLAERIRYGSDARRAELADAIDRGELAGREDRPTC